MLRKTRILAVFLLSILSTEQALASDGETAGIVAAGIVVLVVFFLIGRELFCWYNKTNEHGALLRDIRDELRAIRESRELHGGRDVASFEGAAHVRDSVDQLKNEESPDVAEAFLEVEPCDDREREKLCGVYIRDASFAVQILAEGPGLMCQYSGQAAKPLRKISESCYSIGRNDAEIEIVCDAQGKVISLDFRQGRKLYVCRRLRS